MKVKGPATAKLKTTVEIGRALSQAAKDARRTVGMHGVPSYVWEKGKGGALKP
jgi:hypothetical protein